MNYASMVSKKISIGFIIVIIFFFITMLFKRDIIHWLSGNYKDTIFWTFTFLISSFVGYSIDFFDIPLLVMYSYHTFVDPKEAYKNPIKKISKMSRWHSSGASTFHEDNKIRIDEKQKKLFSSKDYIIVLRDFFRFYIVFNIILIYFSISFLLFSINTESSSLIIFSSIIIVIPLLSILLIYYEWRLFIMIVSKSWWTIESIKNMGSVTSAASQGKNRPLEPSHEKNGSVSTAIQNQKIILNKVVTLIKGNKVDDYLVKKYSKNDIVGMEYRANKGMVDLAVQQGDDLTFFEVMSSNRMSLHKVNRMVSHLEKKLSNEKIVLAITGVTKDNSVIFKNSLDARNLHNVYKILPLDIYQ